MVTIGIDLGTTNSLAAYWTENGPAIIPNVHGQNLTPSVISIDENNEILIGEVARERLISHPHLTASAFKRFMGTDKIYQLGKYSFTPEDLSSFILKALKEDAETFLGDEVSEAVISVPAYFNDMQRKATKRAAELAGLKVERLISEPTAAAIAYGLHQKESETKFLVFDLGGGTFDVSVLELFEGIMEVRSIAGDNYLGGEDFTNLLISYFVQAEKIEISLLNEIEKAFLYKQAEMCKRMLAENNAGSMSFTYKGITYEKNIERVEFENLCSDYIIRLRHPIERTLKDASLSPRDLDAVILIGGATRMPLIKSVVGKMFGKLPFCNINPDETVALGAAVQVALKERNEALKEIILTDVCPYSLGINVVLKDKYGGLEAGFFQPIIERNTTIPVSKVERFSTVRDYQTNINIGIYQGENRLVKDNIKLGEVNVQVRPAEEGCETIDVRFTYDINGLLEVEVVTVNTGEKRSLIIEKNKGSMTQEEIAARLKELQEIKIHPRDKMENKLLIAKGERLYQECLGEKRNYISKLLHQFESLLATQNDHEIKKVAQIIKEKFELIEGWNDY